MSNTFVSDEEVQKLEEQARQIRISIIKMLSESARKTKSGHTAGPLGMADVFTAFMEHEGQSSAF